MINNETVCSEKKLSHVWYLVQAVLRYKLIGDPVTTRQSVFTLLRISCSHSPLVIIYPAAFLTRMWLVITRFEGSKWRCLRTLVRASHSLWYLLVFLTVTMTFSLSSFLSLFLSLNTPISSHNTFIFLLSICLNLPLQLYTLSSFLTSSSISPQPLLPLFSTSSLPSFSAFSFLALYRQPELSEGESSTTMKMHSYCTKEKKAGTT